MKQKETKKIVLMKVRVSYFLFWMNTFFALVAAFEYKIGVGMLHLGLMALMYVNIYANEEKLTEFKEERTSQNETDFK